MPADFYLTRKTNGTWVKFSNVITVDRTGETRGYGSVTGNAGTNVLTVPGLMPLAGSSFVFTLLTGGAGAVTNKQYWVLTPTGSTFQFSESQGGAAVDFTTDITDATILYTTEEFRVWSAQYRNEFQTSLRNQASASTTNPSSEILVPALLTSISTVNSGGTVTTTPVYQYYADSVTGQPLRQTLLSVTHWKFGIAYTSPNTGPPFAYAVWQDGDIVSNNPPEIGT